MKTPGGGKAKGSDFERYVCKRLSLWISRGKREDIFWRSAMSGGRATIQGAKNRAQAGDISAVDPLGAPLIELFLIECKSYKNLNLMGLINPKSAKDGFPTFWPRCEADAAERNKSPMVIAKQNRWGEIVCLYPEHISMFGVQDCVVSTFHHHEMAVLFLDDFLRYARRP